MGPGQQDRRFVVHTWIDIRFDLLRYGGHRLGRRAIHQPGRNICPVTTEIYERPAAVIRRIGEPSQKFVADANLRRPPMPVADYHLPNGAECAVGNRLLRSVQGGIPGRLVVGDEMNGMLLGQCAHPPGILDSESQRLFNHYMDAAGGSRLHNLQMLGNGTEGRNSLRGCLVEHVFQIREEKSRRKIVSFDETFPQHCVRLINADQVDIGLSGTVEYPVHMTVRKAGNGEPERGMLLTVRRNRENEGRKCDAEYADDVLHE